MDRLIKYTCLSLVALLTFLSVSVESRAANTVSVNNLSLVEETVNTDTNVASTYYRYYRSYYSYYRNYYRPGYSYYRYYSNYRPYYSNYRYYRPNYRYYRYWGNGR